MRVSEIRERELEVRDREKKFWRKGREEENEKKKIIIIIINGVSD